MDKYINPVITKILWYYDYRKLKWPIAEEALLWAMSELGEAWEVLAAKGDWVRNNPEEKEPYSKERLAEEIGDAIMMLLVLSIVEDTPDPIEILKEKMERKTNASN